MASSMEGEDREICPSPEELEFSRPVQCPVEGCGNELPSSACLRMHVTRRHQGKPLEKAHGSLYREGCVAFYCPVRSCNRSKEGGEPFPRLGQLKQVESRCKPTLIYRVGSDSLSSRVLLYAALPDGARGEELLVWAVW